LNELYADVFVRCYGMQAVGLRYFNVFGARQDPQGAYAAVIPRWVSAMLCGEICIINGDGDTSRDFCYVANAVQANLRAALVDLFQSGQGHVVNIAVGERTTLTQLHGHIAAALRSEVGELTIHPPRFADFRPGDVRHSLADIGLAERLLGYRPTHDVRQGLQEAVAWYARNLVHG
jgi:UDP-N-acetylglucosamine 4-epimerase